jgi:nucleoid-associated protein YgaU
MGLFSFVKSIGEKLGGGKPVTAENVTAHIKELGLALNPFLVQMDAGNDEEVTLIGWAQTLEDKEKAILAVGNLNGVEKVHDRLKVGAPPAPVAPTVAAAAAPVAAAPVVAEVPTAEEAPQAKFVTVKSGDTLSKIAKEHYGDANAYNAIFEANKPMLKHPDKIFPGQVLRVPVRG